VIEIDGSQRSGSGTILRLSVALSAIQTEPLHIYNIRQNRSRPGLRPQHLEAVLTAARLCDGDLEGAKLDSRELWFKPKKVKGGKVRAEIGTAGSISMLLMTVLPICIFAEDTVHLHVSKGGTDVPHSPTINYLRCVFLPVLKHLGVNTGLTVHKFGYYPKGMGEVTLTVEPCKSLQPLRLGSFGKVRSVKGVSTCTFLAERRVAERQARSASDYLEKRNYATDIEVVNDRSNNMQKGSSLVLWARTDAGVILGADAIGEIRKPSEVVGREAAQRLFVEISSRATVDVHLADMLIPYLALTQGTSEFLTRTVSDHLDTNIWLSEKILGSKFSVERTNDLYKIRKLDAD